MHERDHGIYRDDQNGCLPCCSEEGQYPSVGYSVESGGAEPTEKSDNNQSQAYATRWCMSMAWGCKVVYKYS